MHEIARVGAWSIRVLPWPHYMDRDIRAWWSINVRNVGGQRGSYWLEWNGQRMARSSELERMAGAHPAIADEVSVVLHAWSEVRNGAN